MNLSHSQICIYVQILSDVDTKSKQRLVLLIRNFLIMYYKIPSICDRHHAVKMWEGGGISAAGVIQ
jgi:hypothetical protein